MANPASGVSSNIQRINTLYTVQIPMTDYGQSPRDACLFHAQYGLQTAYTTPKLSLPFM